MADIYETLRELKIPYREIEHRAVYTIEQALAENIPGRIEGVECKNLFVKNKRRYYLLVLRADKRADLKALAAQTGEGKLSFASEQQLREILGLEAGSVTPLGILNDRENRVTLLLDRELKGQTVLVHPNVNTKTMALAFDDLLRFVQAMQHGYLFV